MDSPSPADHRDPGMSPSPPPTGKKNAKARVPPPPPPRVKKTQGSKKEKPPSEKLPYDMTQEELAIIVAKQVSDHFAPRKPKPKL